MSKVANMRPIIQVFNTLNERDLIHSVTLDDDGILSKFSLSDIPKHGKIAYQNFTESDGGYRVEIVDWYNTDSEHFHDAESFMYEICSQVVREWENYRERGCNLSDKWLRFLIEQGHIVEEVKTVKTYHRAK